ncbi:YjzC family protein [Leisingera aquaemixtae]|uniref:YjzC family protein n=1 Tax=Leisingera aquaemixtae TaxID=1396826 RepID=UPI0021A79FF2|nr:YjzC family protein [Leisingera aquaemixtae]UWQ26453.1 YjzC family protein [Leisingera aquaemixtae]
MSKKPGESSGRDGGIFQEVGPRGGTKPNYTTVPDNKPMPPTSKPGHTWKPVRRTPDSKR